MNTSSSPVNDALSNVFDLINAVGPMTKDEEVTVNGVTRTFTFRRLPFLEGDTIRSAAFGSDGKFDGSKYAGNNARLVAATLLDQHGAAAFSVEAINAWPLPVVDAFAVAANKVNALMPGAQEEAVKNSEATPVVASS